MLKNCPPNFSELSVLFSVDTAAPSLLPALPTSASAIGLSTAMRIELSLEQAGLCLKPEKPPMLPPNSEAANSAREKSDGWDLLDARASEERPRELLEDTQPSARRSAQAIQHCGRPAGPVFSDR